MTNTKGLKFYSIPNNDLMKTLETLLEQAREGSIQGAAFVILNRPGEISTGWGGIVSNNYIRTLGGLKVLEARLTNLAIQDTETL